MDSVGEGEGGKIWENGIYNIMYEMSNGVTKLQKGAADLKNGLDEGATGSKQIASPVSMHVTECLGLVHWDNPEGWYGEGGGFRMGNTCIPVADSFRYLAKPIQYCKV